MLFDASAACSMNPTTGQDAQEGFGYLKLPAFRTQTDQDVTVTIGGKAAASSTLNVYFAFGNQPIRNIYFRNYHTTASTGDFQNWFPSDGVLRGVFVGCDDGTPAVGGMYNARDTNSLSQITLNGEQNTTYTYPGLLAAGMDEVVSGGGTDYGGVDTYAMLRNFPINTGSQYVTVSRTASVGLQVIGVMTDGL